MKKLIYVLFIILIIGCSDLPTGTQAELDFNIELINNSAPFELYFNIVPTKDVFISKIIDSYSPEFLDISMTNINSNISENDTIVIHPRMGSYGEDWYFKFYIESENKTFIYETWYKYIGNNP